MPEYRISKYEPGMRAHSGCFLGNAWTSVSDIGQTFEGQVLTPDSYFRVESAYVEAVLRCMSSAELDTLTVDGLEVYPGPLAAEVAMAGELESMRSRIRDGATLVVAEVAMVARLNLREALWCRLAGHRGFFAHFGYDFYMYVGSSGPGFVCPEMPEGLYAEPFRSPHHPE